jgi:hypothetical protein
MRTSEKYRHGKLPLALNQLFDKSDRLHPNIDDVVKKTSAVSASAMIKLIRNLVFAIHIVVNTTNTTTTTHNPTKTTAIIAVAQASPCSKVHQARTAANAAATSAATERKK